MDIKLVKLAVGSVPFTHDQLENYLRSLFHERRNQVEILRSRRVYKAWSREVVYEPGPFYRNYTHGQALKKLVEVYAPFYFITSEAGPVNSIDVLTSMQFANLNSMYFLMKRLCAPATKGREQAIQFEICPLVPPWQLPVDLPTETIRTIGGASIRTFVFGGAHQRSVPLGEALGTIPSDEVISEIRFGGMKEKELDQVRLSSLVVYNGFCPEASYIEASVFSSRPRRPDGETFLLQEEMIDPVRETEVILAVTDLCAFVSKG